MNDGKKFRMYSLSMAVEIRENITLLVVNTLKQISIVSWKDSKELWENISALMMNSDVTNLLIEKQIAKTLMSDYITFLLLCFTHL